MTIQPNGPVVRLRLDPPVITLWFLKTGVWDASAPWVDAVEYVADPIFIDVYSASARVDAPQIRYRGLLGVFAPVPA